MFPQGNETKHLTEWRELGFKLLYQLFTPHTFQLKPFRDLLTEFNLRNCHILAYHQVMQFRKQYGLEPNLLFKQTFLDSLARTSCYSITDLYPNMQVLNGNPLKDSNVARWKMDFPASALVQRIVEGNNKIRHIVTSELQREMQFKIMHRAYVPYFVPYQRVQTDSLTSICPKCKDRKPTLAHCLWYCPKIVTMCESLGTYTRSVTGTRLPMQPLLCIFGIVNENTDRQDSADTYAAIWT